jgi:hypothetical protein
MRIWESFVGIETGDIAKFLTHRNEDGNRTGNKDELFRSFKQPLVSYSHSLTNFAPEPIQNLI